MLFPCRTAVRQLLSDDDGARHAHVDVAQLLPERRSHAIALVPEDDNRQLRHHTSGNTCSMFEVEINERFPVAVPQRLALKRVLGAVDAPPRAAFQTELELLALPPLQDEAHFVPLWAFSSSPLQIFCELLRGGDLF